MRVIEHLSLATNVCTLYNKGVGVVNIPFSCCEKEGEDVSGNKYIEKMLNHLVVPNNFILSLSLSLSLSLNSSIIFYLANCVSMQCVARDGMSTKDLLQVPFVFSCIDSNDSLFLCTLSSLILVQIGRVPLSFYLRKLRWSLKFSSA